MVKSNQDWKEMYEKERKLRQEAEGEMSIVKGIGMNSPEVIKLKKEICEVRQDNRKLSQQIEDSIDRMRKAGLL
jgi:septal ring factor EnvC (AmiA/AmiB activator)